MQIVGLAITGLAGIVSFVCFVIVLIKLFGEEGIGKAILGFICGLYTFIWGWQNADRMQVRSVMTYWSLSIGASFLGQLLKALGSS